MGHIQRFEDLLVCLCVGVVRMAWSIQCISVRALPASHSDATCTAMSLCAVPSSTKFRSLHTWSSEPGLRECGWAL